MEFTVEGRVGRRAGGGVRIDINLIIAQIYAAELSEKAREPCKCLTWGSRTRLRARKSGGFHRRGLHL